MQLALPVEKQLEISKSEDSAAGIKPGQIEYFLHDAKIPRIFTDSLCDMCKYTHLLLCKQLQRTAGDLSLHLLEP